MNRILTLSIDILDFIKVNGSTSAAQLQKHFQAAPSTIYKIMQTLENKQMVERHQNRNALYQIGAKAFAIGHAYAPDMLLTMRPYLQEIATKLKLTAVLGIEQNGVVLFLDKATPPQTENLVSSAQIGGTEGLYFTSLGKALLSQFSKAELEKKLGYKNLTPKTPNTHTTIPSLWRDIIRSRCNGFFVDKEEHALGKICISVPLFNPAGKVIAAVSVSGMKTQFTDFATIGSQIIEFLHSCPYRQLS